jgi:hypothetical protein
LDHCKCTCTYSLLNRELALASTLSCRPTLHFLLHCLHLSQRASTIAMTTNSSLSVTLLAFDRTKVHPHTREIAAASSQHHRHHQRQHRDTEPRHCVRRRRANAGQCGRSWQHDSRCCRLCDVEWPLAGRLQHVFCRRRILFYGVLLPQSHRWDWTHRLEWTVWY